jgi:2'-hydroxyisoflavone reductase
VREAFGDRAINVRPGLITGPGDPTDRIRHWIARFERGGEILVPGKPTDPVQYIDARDLTGWSIRMLEQGDSGTYNGTGPSSPLSWAELVYGIRAVSSNDLSFSWVSEEFLTEHEIQGFSYMPWFPSSSPMAAFNYINISRSLATGLTFRPLATTAFDMLEEYRASTETEGPRGFGRRGGMSWEQEAEVLALWHEVVGK